MSSPYISKILHHLFWSDQKSNIRKDHVSCLKNEFLNMAENSIYYLYAIILEDLSSSKKLNPHKHTRNS